MQENEYNKKGRSIRIRIETRLEENDNIEKLNKKGRSIRIRIETILKLHFSSF